MLRTAVAAAILFAALAARATPQLSRGPRVPGETRAEALERAGQSVRDLTAQGSTGCGTGAGVAPQVSQPKLQYCGGRVLSQATIVAVLWGPPDPLAATPSCSGDFPTCLDAYYRRMIQDPQFDWLDEYQTTIPSAGGTPGTNQHIARPGFYGVVQITPKNTAAVVGELAIETELVGQIQAGNLPAPIPDTSFDGGNGIEPGTLTIYEVHFPLEVDPSDTCSIACGAFCAYHDSWASNDFGALLGLSGPATAMLAVIPSHMPPGYSGGRDCALCGSRTDWFANLGGSISHETVESITDPDVGLAGGSFTCAPPVGWYDLQPFDEMSVHGEIGDMCEGLPDGTNSVTDVSFAAIDGGVYEVQREWSNNFQACLGEAQEAFSAVLPEGTQLDQPGSTVSITLQTSAPFDAGSTLVPLHFTAHGLPDDPGVQVSFFPATIDASGSTQVRLEIAEDAGTTEFTFGITAESNDGNTLDEAVLSVAPPDFSAGVAPETLALTAGGPPVSAIVTSALVSGSARGFSLSTSGAAGVNVTPSSGQLGTSLQIALGADAGSPSVDGTLLLDVTSGGVTHRLPIALTLAGDDAALSAPPNLTVSPGGSTSFTLASRVRAGQPQPLQLYALNLPIGATASCSPPFITAGGSATCTLAMPDSQAQGPISITLVGAGPIAETSINVPFEVVAGSGCDSGGAGATMLWAAPGLLALLFVWKKRTRKMIHEKVN